MQLPKAKPTDRVRGEGEDQGSRVAVACQPTAEHHAELYAGGSFGTYPDVRVEA